MSLGHQGVEGLYIRVGICQMIDSPVHLNTALHARRQLGNCLAFNEVSEEVAGLKVGIEMGEGEVGKEVDGEGGD